MKRGRYGRRGQPRTVAELRQSSYMEDVSLRHDLDDLVRLCTADFRTVTKTMGVQSIATNKLHYL